MPRKAKLETTENNVVQDQEFDGSTLPSVLAGPASARPFRPDQDRTTYHAIDTGEVSMYVGNTWIYIEHRNQPTDGNDANKV